MRSIAALLLVTAACGDNVDTSNGAACSSDDACSSGLCVTEYANGKEPTGGFCTEQCEWLDNFQDTCAEGVCLRYNQTGEKFCYNDCESDADCRTEDGWKCSTISLIYGIYACVPSL